MNSVFTADGRRRFLIFSRSDKFDKSIYSPGCAAAEM
ncbi:hypothetical protein EM595_1510 [Duffyella gerundensis]|uniref:Uncharacterized protein n=1 Tax=Duffyella gerundensis TaxID=1619313 RepID=A0A0U5L3L0_9GAMM|nr:hypothetical protein EM595_1510 [Duffyella gerundensis]